MSGLEIVLEYLPITLRKEIISNIGTEENKIEEIKTMMMITIQDLENKEKKFAYYVVTKTLN